MSGNSLMRVSMPCLHVSVPSYPNVSSLPPNITVLKIMVLKRQCNTMRQGTGSDSKTSPSSPTSPFFLTASCSSLDVSSTRRSRRRDELTSALSTYPCFNKYGYSNPQTGVQLRDSPAMLVVAIIIIQPCADSERRPSNFPVTIKALEGLREAPGVPDHLGRTGPRAKDVTSVNPLTGTHTAALLDVASPTVPPTIPPTVHPPISVTILITEVSTSGTPRIVSRSSQQL